MNKSLVAIGVTLVIAGCSTTPRVDTVREETLSTSFAQESIKVKTNCRWWTWDKKQCEIVRVESTGTAASNGGTAVNRNNAMIRACDNARANVRHWFREEVMSDRVSKTIANSVEKSGSTESQNGEAGTGSTSNRANDNNTRYQITHNIRVQASGHLEGFRVVGQKVVGNQEVSCTIQWDEDNNRNLDKFPRIDVMKKAILSLLLLQACFTVNATTVTVEGVGVDRETAKLDAFKTAIENVCGTAVLSDREHNNNQTVHNKVTTYSSCRVENYKIIRDNGNRLKVVVTLSDNKMSDRLYNKSNSKRFDGKVVKAQIETLRLEQKKGDELIDAIFRDYPYRAYRLNDTKDPYITSDNNRNIYLMVPYDLRWNYNFITSMNEAFKNIEVNRGRARITVMAKHPDDFLLGHKDDFFINDLSRLEYIKTKFMDQNEVRLNIKAKDDAGRNVLNVCYNPEYRAGGIFYSIGVDEQLTIFGNDKHDGTLRIKLTFPAEMIRDIYVDIVAARDCKL